MLEIMFDDLSRDAQERVLSYFGIDSPEVLDLDVIPLFALT